MSNLSDRKKKERRVRQALILKGALDVFKEKGIDGSTMDEIAIKSGFGKATLYYYFKSKEEVFSAILTNGWSKIWYDLEPVIAEQNKSPRETFINILLKIADNVNSRGERFTFIWDDSEETALLLQKKNNDKVKFQWQNDEEDDGEYYFEFKIQVDEITKDVSLIVTDFAEEDELEESKMLWDNLVSDLKQVIGAS